MSSIEEVGTGSSFDASLNRWFKFSAGFDKSCCPFCICVSAVIPSLTRIDNLRLARAAKRASLESAEESLPLGTDLPFDIGVDDFLPLKACVNDEKIAVHGFNK